MPPQQPVSETHVFIIVVDSDEGVVISMLLFMLCLYHCPVCLSVKLCPSLMANALVNVKRLQV